MGRRKEKRIARRNHIWQMRNKLKHIKWLLIGLLFFYSLEIFSQTTYHKAIPDLPSTPRLVNDFADMLSSEEEKLLEEKLLNFEKESSNEVTIVTVEDLGEMGVSEFTIELGRKWNIGKAEKKNGVLLVASKLDRKINISPGYGLSGVLPDITCGRIIRNSIVPNFKAGKYYAGFDEATTSIIDASKGEFTKDEFQQKEIPLGLLFLMFLVFFGLMFLFFYMRRNSKNIYVSRRGYKYDDNDWGSRGGGWFGGGFGGGGFGGNDDSGGGGFGGFGGGGGGFDGGGASGSW